jgi:Tfp pilus assembly protein PilP
MRLAKAGGNLLAALAISVCFAPGGWAQQALSANRPGSAAKAKTAAAAPTQATAPIPAPTAAPVDEANASPVNKRDPFAALINNKKEASAGMHLPPGKAGLVIATVRVDGTVRSGGGMIAVVSNPANSVYFIREGDRLYDGDVEKIGLDGVTFRENSKDAFGHPIERTVTKRIYASAGE